MNFFRRSCTGAMIQHTISKAINTTFVNIFLRVKMKEKVWEITVHITSAKFLNTYAANDARISTCFRWWDFKSWRFTSKFLSLTGCKLLLISSQHVLIMLFLHIKFKLSDALKGFKSFSAFMATETSVEWQAVAKFKIAFGRFVKSISSLLSTFSVPFLQSIHLVSKQQLCSIILDEGATEERFQYPVRHWTHRKPIIITRVCRSTRKAIMIFFLSALYRFEDIFLRYWKSHKHIHM